LVFEIPLHETSVKYDPICFQEAKESDLFPKKGTSPHYETCSELDQKIKDDPADSSEKKNQAKIDEKELLKGFIEKCASGNTQLTESRAEHSARKLIPLLIGNTTEISAASHAHIAEDVVSDCEESSFFESLTLDPRKQLSHCVPIVIGQNLVFKENKDSPLSKETFSNSDQNLSDSFEKSEVSYSEISLRDKYFGNSDSDATVICESIASEVNTLDESVSGQFNNNFNLSDQSSTEFDAFSGNMELFHIRCESFPFKSYQYS
jgi:hypothetical protein